MGFLSTLNQGTVTGTQVWEELSGDENSCDTIGRPRPDIAAQQKATGEALYYSDLPRRQGE